MKTEIKEENGIYTAILEGWLDTNMAAQFREELQPLFDNADKQIVLDCKGLEYITSSSLRTFLLLRKEVAAKGGHITIANVKDEIKEVFRMTGFYNMFDIKE
ncbi:MAG: STAS domain-containing protein [Prevotella sp.]|nr:STAS domain-containing protein [Prevotella sp.]